MRSLVLLMLGLVGIAVGCNRSEGVNSGDPSSGAAGAGSTTSQKPAVTAGSASAAAAVVSPEQRKAEAAFARLVEAHRNEDPDGWMKADAELAELGPDAVPVLVTGLKSSERETRELATAVLARIGADAEKASEALVIALDDESPLVRVNAASVLALHSGSSVPAERTEKLVAALLRLLADDNLNLRKSAVVSLGNLGAKGAPAVPELVPQLQHSDSELQSMTASTLGKIGTAAEQAIPALESLAKSDTLDVTVRTAVAEALESVRRQTSTE